VIRCRTSSSLVQKKDQKRRRRRRRRKKEEEEEKKKKEEEEEEEEEELQVTLMDAQKTLEMARKYVCQFDIKGSIVTMSNRLENELCKLKAQ
jgi:hypothetical protein